MSEAPNCETTCDMPCAETCSHAQTIDPLSVEQVLERYEKEATQGTFDTGRYQCEYFSWGEGAPLIFIHNLLEDYRSQLWLSAYLSRSFRCIGYRLPQGDTDGAKVSRYSHQDLTDDLFALQDHLNAARCYVYASGFGSTIALHAMQQQPSRFPRAILHGAMASQPSTRSQRMMSWLLSHLPGTLGQTLWKKQFLDKLHYGEFPEAIQDRWQFYVNNVGQIPLSALGWRMRMLHRIDLTEKLSEIKQPVMLVQGDRDHVISPDVTNVLLGKLPTVAFAQIPDAQHLPNLSHPEDLSRAIHHFLTPPQENCSSKMNLACDQPVSGMNVGMLTPRND